MNAKLRLPAFAVAIVYEQPASHVFLPQQTCRGPPITTDASSLYKTANQDGSIPSYTYS